MPLLDLWAAKPGAITSLTIEQIVATAGDGKLRDDSACSKELRQYLTQVTSEQLAVYARHCLSQPFAKSGLVLQDVVNELGRRLDYNVSNGRYQGTQSRIGFDGIWHAPDGSDVVVEVKTTDAYRIPLDTIAAYRDRLRDDNQIGRDASILIVVGREDTGELEAQVRGSKHAWDCRLISIDALLKLVELKESTEAGVTGAKLRSVLAPVEYTRLDGLIDLMFTAAKDVESAVEAEVPEASEGTAWEFTDPKTLAQKRDIILKGLAARDGIKLIKHSRALYWDADHAYRAVCTLSKRYTKKGQTPYWFAFHPAWDEFLGAGSRGTLVLGCVDLDVAFAIPVAEIRSLLQEFNTSTKKDGGSYWHLKIVQSKAGKYALQLPKSGSSLPLEQFAVTLPTPTSPATSQLR